MSDGPGKGATFRSRELSETYCLVWQSSFIAVKTGIQEIGPEALGVLNLALS